MSLQAKIVALARLRLGREFCHRLVMLRVLEEAHGRFRRIGELDEVRVSSEHIHDERDDYRKIVERSVDRDDERIVRTRRLDDVVQRLFRLDVLLLL